MKKILFIFLLTTQIIFSASAQELSKTESRNMKNDSLLNEKMMQIGEDIYLSEHERIEDSIAKEKLEAELQMLKQSEKAKISEYKLKIRELETKDSIRYAKVQTEIDILKTQTDGFPVAPFGDTLFTIYSNIGSFSPKERALNISKKIINLYKDDDFIADSLKVTDNYGVSYIVYKGNIIGGLTDIDAMWYGDSRGKLAVQSRNIIQKAIQDEISKNSLRYWLIKIAGILLTLVGIVLLIYLINKLFKWTEGLMRKKMLSTPKAIKLEDYELLSPERLLVLILWAHKIFKYIVFFIVVYLSLPILLSIFPNTKTWADVLISWILSPITSIFYGFVNYLPNLITIVIVFLVTRYVVRFFNFLANEIKNDKLKLKNFYAEWALPTFNIIRILLYVFMFIVIFPYLPGSESPVFKGVSVFLGVLISFGSSSAIGNIIAGLVITYMRPFKIGDRIRVGEHSGDVIEKSLLNTRIRTIKNEEITFPNSLILSGQTINYSISAAEKGLILHTSVTIGYDVNWRKMHEALLEAAERTNLVEKEPKPFVFQTSLDDFYVTYQLNVYTKAAKKQAQIYSDLHANILDSCFEKGIEIMSPHFRAERSGDALQVPEKYIADYFTPPAEPEKKTEKKK